MKIQIIFVDGVLHIFRRVIVLTVFILQCAFIKTNINKKMKKLTFITASNPIHISSV